MRAVHWFRNDLRSLDNTALAATPGWTFQLLTVFCGRSDHVINSCVARPTKKHSKEALSCTPPTASGSYSK